MRSGGARARAAAIGGLAVRGGSGRRAALVCTVAVLVGASWILGFLDLRLWTCVWYCLPLAASASSGLQDPASSPIDPQAHACASSPPRESSRSGALANSGLGLAVSKP